MIIIPKTLHFYHVQCVSYLMPIFLLFDRKNEDFITHWNHYNYFTMDEKGSCIVWFVIFIANEHMNAHIRTHFVRVHLIRSIISKNVWHLAKQKEEMYATKFTWNTENLPLIFIHMHSQKLYKVWDLPRHLRQCRHAHCLNALALWCSDIFSLDLWKVKARKHTHNQHRKISELRLYESAVSTFLFHSQSERDGLAKLWRGKD